MDGRREGSVPSYLAAFVFLGLGSSMAGPALSHLRDHVGTDDAGIGLVFVGQSAGYVAGSLLIGRLLDRGSGHRWWVSSMVLAVAGSALIAAATSLAALVAAFVLIGFAYGFCDVCGNTLVLWSRPDHSDPALHGLHLCFAVGALLSPLVVNRAIAWTDSLWPVLLPLAVIGGACSVGMFRNAEPVRTREEAPVAVVTAYSARGWHIAAICAFFLVYVGVEAGFAGWIHSYVEQIGYGGAGTATGITAIFWTGFAVGRVVAIWLSRLFSSGWMLAGSMSLMMLAAGAFFAFRGPGAALWFATFLFGLAIAPQFAAMISFAESHLALSGRSTSAIIAAAGFGGLVMPWMLGLLFDAYGARILPPVIVVAAAVAVVAGLVVGRMLSARQRPPATSMNAPVT